MNDHEELRVVDLRYFGQGREPTVEDGDLDAAVRAMDNEGWTCEAHEPGIDCKVCARIQPIAVRAIIAAWLGVSDE